ncbi:AAA family ATPase [Streptomyces sp. NPDC058674]|uniref:ATP-binding protein n=1 Tax=Streptomyces sp. NPDC058674 TaxID=3346592 RepID=UPI003656882E
MSHVTEPKGRAPQPLLERESEILAIHRSVDDLFGVPDNGSATRRGGVLTFAGSGGIGKTTLLAEARRHAVERGCTVLFARGGEQERQVPFHVMRQLIQPTFAAMTEEERRDVLGNWYGIIAPALGLTAAPKGPAAPDPQGVRDGLDWVVTHLTVRSAPVVLVLDDAHWADAESLAWLTAFAARAEELAMLIMVACRPDEIPADAASLRALMGRQGTRPHELASLSTGAVARIVRDTLGENADDVFCRECWAITGGNPFEVVELAMKGRDRGLKPHQENIPQLRDLASAVKGSGLIERMEQLGTSTVRLAWAAAVLGTGIPTGIVGSVAALGEAQTAEAIDQLHTARILTVLPSLRRTDVVEFFHPLIATAVYRSIPPGVRVAMHGMAAQALVDDGHGAAAAARHLLEMHPDGDPWVVQQLRQAARESFSAGAPDAARRYLARALREPPDVEDRAEVLFELGSANLLHDPGTTINQLRTALEEPKTEQGLREAITYRLAQALAHTGQLGAAAELLAEEARGATSSRTRLRMQAEQFKWNSVRFDEENSPARSRLLSQFAKRLTGRGLAERHILGLRSWDAAMRGEPVAVSLDYADQALTGGLSWTDQDFGFEVPAVVAPSPSCTATSRAVPRSSSTAPSWSSRRRAGAARTCRSSTPCSATSGTGADGSPRPRTSSATVCRSPTASDTASRPSGTRSAPSSRRCSPAATSPRPRRSPVATSWRTASPRPSSTPTPRPYGASSSWPRAGSTTRRGTSPRRASASTSAARETRRGAPGSSTWPSPR